MKGALHVCGGRGGASMHEEYCCVHMGWAGGSLLPGVGVPGMLSIPY